MIITDTLGNEIGYLPVTLTEGAESNIISLRAYPEIGGANLSSTFSAKVEALAKIVGDPEYVNIFESPLDLSEFIGNFASIQLKFLASTEVVGLERVAMNIGGKKSQAAGWLA